MAIAIGFMDVCSTHEVISGILGKWGPPKSMGFNTKMV
jgi:hypothetical protein